MSSPGKQKADRKAGNMMVIELLETYLETAKQHPAFNHIAIGMTGYPNIAALDYAGDVALERATRDTLAHLLGKVQGSIDNWTLPKRNESLDESHVVYNVANGPLGFDFVVWLVDAEMTRIRAGAPGPLRVGFWLGKNGQPSPDQMGWLTKLFRPALELIGAEEDDRAIYGHHKPVFVLRDIVKAAKTGEQVPVLNIKAPYKPVPVVTITCREAEHDQHRNSNLDAWLAFAAWLRSQGEDVVFVRDTAKAYEPIGGFASCPTASLNIRDRMILYQGAKANLFVANGPGALAQFSDRPWLQFIDVNDNEFTEKWWKDTAGVNVGEQLPWSNAKQRIVWAKDTYENILSAWKALPSINRKAA